MKIFVDADSCPAKVRNAVQKKSIQLNIKLFFVANREIKFTEESDLFKMIVCENKTGSADDYIFTNSSEGDLVITKDLLLAERLLTKNVTVINDRGTIFSPEVLKKMLKQREESMLMKACGVNTGARFNSYGQKELTDFYNCFMKVLEKR